MNTSNNFVNAARELSIIAESISELLAKRRKQQETLFASFKAALIQAAQGESQEWQAIVTEGFPLLDSETLKTLLSASDVSGNKASTLWRKDKGFALKNNRLTPERLPETLQIIESLVNPFEQEKEAKPEKSEWEKMVSAIKAVMNRLDKGTQAASPLMADSLADWLKHYQHLAEAEKRLGEE